MNIFNRRLVFPAVVLLAITTLLLVIPAVIKYQVREWLLLNGGEQVAVNNVDFNPFLGTLYLEGLDVKVDAETTLSFRSAALDLAWLPLLKKQIAIQAVTLSGFHALIDNRDILRIGGIRIADTAQTDTDLQAETSAWLVGVDSLTLNDFHILYQDNAVATDVTIDSMRLERLSQWQPDSAAHLEFAGSINGCAANLTAELTPLAQQPSITGTLSLQALSLAQFDGLVSGLLDTLEGSLTLDSDFDVQFAEGELRFNHEGRLQLADFSASSSEGSVQARNFDLQGDFKLSQTAADTRASHSGSLELEQTTLSSQAGIFDNTASRWRGDTELQLTGPEQSLTVQTEGELVVDTTSAGSEQADLYFQFERFSHSGSFTFADADPQATLMLASDMVIRELQASAEQRNYQLLSLGDLQVDGFLLQDMENIAMTGIVLEDFYLAKPAESAERPEETLQAFLHIASATLTRPAIADNTLTIDSIEYQGWQSRLYRNPQGEWSVARLLDVINRLAGEPADVAPDEKESPTALTYLVSRIETLGEDNRLVIVDESVTPTFAVTVDLQRLILQNITSADTNEPWRLDLQAAIGKHTRLTTEGRFKPLLEPPALNLTADLTALDLPQLSSYTREGLGLLLNSGTLDAQLKLETLDSELNGAAKLKLHQLGVESLPGENTLQSSIPVPLNTALSTLRDKNNTIALEIPITGDIRDPSFNINDALTQALARGVQRGALSYLTFALQPYGSLITAAKYAGEMATRVTLNPVYFDAGQSLLKDDSLDYLNKVAQVLDDRPNIAVKLCGVAVEADHVYLAQLRQQAADNAAQSAASGASTETAVDADPEELTLIAEQRAAVIKDYLVETFGVSASRLVGCLPRTELADPDSLPRTDLLL